MSMRLVLQTESSECGLACLCMVASHFGYSTDLADLRRRFSISLKGATLAQIVRHAEQMNFSARPLRLELEHLDKLQLPAILHWNLKHYVVLQKVTRKGVLLLDPAVGMRSLSFDEVSKAFTGVALELSPSAEFKKADTRAQVSLRDLTGQVHGLRRALLQVMALALALEIFALAAPLINQFVIDSVIVNSDRELLIIIMMGFALLTITQTTINLARSWFLMRWSIDVGLQWSVRVFAHLTKLPVAFFEKRHLGDVVSRFGSMAAIQQTLTSIFVGSALDGLMAFLALGMMFLYSAQLSLAVIVATLLYAVLRWAFYQPFREASQERMVVSAKENTHFLETIRAITPLKLFGRESERRARWQNLKLDVINRDIRTQKLSILFSVSNTAITSGQGLVLLYIGAGLVMQNSLTVGMLTAFLSYAGTFSGRISNLINVWVDWKMLSLHAERLSDIVLEEAEVELPMETDISRLSPTITLRDLSFRYAEGEPWVLNKMNMTVAAGESVAFVGASGCGKTTITKIMLGLLAPTEGEVLLDGVPIRQIGLSAYRQIIGTVMQDDVLLAGSIAENISFFDVQMDMERIKECAELAAVHEEIATMPMGYQTLVGDMGSSISGGQKQRILLARALYKKPKILALDEATSHLDVVNEKRVTQALARLQLTRIIVAHRPETIAGAQRVVEMGKGGILRDLRAEAIA